MRTIINQALTQKAQDLLIELNSEDVFAKRLKAIIASFNHPIKTVADIFDVDSINYHQMDKQTKEKSY